MKLLQGYFCKPHRAFTLVELCVVVALIMALAGLMIPGLQKAQMASRKTVCQNNLRQIFSAFEFFAADNNNYWPARLALDANGAGLGNFVYFTRPYLPANSNYGQWDNGKGKEYICPEAYRLRHYRAGTSYGINNHIHDSYAVPSLANKLRILQPNRTILLGDGCWSGSLYTSWIDEGHLPAKSYPPTSTATPTHANGAGNLLFCDGHIEYWPDTSILSQSKYFDGSADDVWSRK